MAHSIQNLRRTLQQRKSAYKWLQTFRYVDILSPNPSSEAAMTSSSQHELNSSSSLTSSSTPLFGKFTDKTPAMARARATYFKTIIGGMVMILLMVWAIFPIFWGALWKIPSKTLQGWIVDFDGGIIGRTVVDGLQTPAGSSAITWTVVPASRFLTGLEELGNAVVEEKAWVAVSINPSASLTFLSSLASPNASYDGSEAISVWAAEARNENAYRNIIRPSLQASLEVITKAFAVKAASSIPTSTNVTALLSTSPQTIVSPIYYTIHNMAPFNIPVATAVTFVGLIYQLILSFFVVMILLQARDLSGFTNTLSTKSLIALRFISSFTAYFILSLFYSLLSLAFKLEFSHKFGPGGFVVFWMMNYVGMLSLGLGLEAMITLLTLRFIPFFMLSLVIVNVSVTIFPLEVMPIIFHYGYATPFYNISKIARTIVFETKNRVGFNFAILIVWVVISCITLPLIQWWVRRGHVSNLQVQFKEEDPFEQRKDDRIVVLEPQTHQEWKAEDKNDSTALPI